MYLIEVPITSNCVKMSYLIKTMLHLQTDNDATFKFLPDHDSYFQRLLFHLFTIAYVNWTNVTLNSFDAYVLEMKSCFRELFIGRYTILKYSRLLSIDKSKSNSQPTQKTTKIGRNS